MPIVLVTGATDGIGRETARELVRRGANVIVHGRSAAKANAVRAELEGIVRGSALEPVLGDFSKLASVRAMGEALAARPERIDVLLNNAGVFLNDRETTEDGFEATFAVNHLAPFLLTHLLLPRLSDGQPARIVNVSSVAHSRGSIDLRKIGSADGFEPYRAYATSKLANVLFTVELARRIGPGPLVVNALHPGVVSTKLLTEGFRMRGSDSLAEGAATSVALALAPELASVTGRYFAGGPAPVLRPGRVVRRCRPLRQGGEHGRARARRRSRSPLLRSELRDARSGHRGLWMRMRSTTATTPRTDSASATARFRCSPSATVPPRVTSPRCTMTSSSPASIVGSAVRRRTMLWRTRSSRVSGGCEGGDASPRSSPRPMPSTPRAQPSST